MGLFDNLIQNAVNAGTQAAKRAVSQAVSDGKAKAAKAVQDAINNKTVTFTFNALPTSLAQLQALPEATMDTPYKTAALTVLALNAYAANPEAGKAMLDWLNGPADFTERDRQFLEEHVSWKPYVVRSYFKGATPANNYAATAPYVLEATSTATSFAEENYATIWFTSGGADSPREVKLRKKPSTGQWFLWEQFLCADVRQPVEADPWA